MSEPTEPATDAPFDTARFRQVLGHFASGVTVVASLQDGAPVGLAVASFASLSLEPPLVLFCADKSSSSWPRIRETGVFSVNILSEDQEDICRVFASKADDKFAGIGWHKSALGAPIIEGVLAWIDCEISDVVDEGDHEVVVGRVRELEVVHEGGPLVFFRGGFGRFEP